MANPAVVEYPNLALIRQGVDMRFPIRCRQLELLVRPLSIFEEDLVAQLVAEDLANLPAPRQTSMRQTTKLAIIKLEMAQTSAPGMKDAKVFQAELGAMTPGEIDHLFKQYAAGCDKVSPVFERLTHDQVSKMVAALKKSTPNLGTTLIELSFFQLVDICHSLLSQDDSPTDSSTG